MEEDILNYSPTLMFRGTPCVAFDIFLNYFVMEICFRKLIFVAFVAIRIERNLFQLKILIAIFQKSHCLVKINCGNEI